MKEYESLISRYRNKGALVDSNLLLLYFIGKYEKNLITVHKRTKKYTIKDFEIVERIFHLFSKIVTTPNILTEVSNLSGQSGSLKKIKDKYFEHFKNQIETLDENYIQSRNACQVNYFASLGLTDTAILLAAKDNYLVFTDDLDFYGTLIKADIDAINFTYISALNLFST
ncbi:hypothetical protein HYR54_12440 [Candidatus Acetothermia bacterium]|nr:hypothetical protein [Candidatus Acetothermia bacterium]